MNVERGLRRLLITISGLLVVAGAVVGAGLSSGPIFCTYTVRLSDGTVVEIRARYYATPEDVAAVALRLHPETKNVVIFDPPGVEPRPGSPYAPAVPGSCGVNEGTFTRLSRYANDVGVGVMLAVVLSAVLWTIFFTLRWVARGFKSAT
jgi:hypothetical protein